jgi:hypothetical protein
MLTKLKKEIFIRKLEPDVFRCTFQPHPSFWHSTVVISIIVSPALSQQIRWLVAMCGRSTEYTTFFLFLLSSFLNCFVRKLSALVSLTFLLLLHPFFLFPFFIYFAIIFLSVSSAPFSF